MRKSAQRLIHALLGLCAAGCVPVSGASSGDYQGSAQVRELIEEMTLSHGFAAEQLEALFAEAERKQVILEAISRPPSGSSRGASTGRSSSPMPALPAAWISGASTRRR